MLCRRLASSAAASAAAATAPAADVSPDHTLHNAPIPPGDASTTDFGFSRVPVEQKADLVAEVFHRVASKYDIMNDIMSLGTHRLWKTRFVSNLALSELSRSSCPMHILDVAGGTGDIAFRCIEELSRWSTVSVLQPRLSHRVTICDINQSMLDIGKRRATSLGYLSPQSPVQPSFLCADAQSLAMIPDASVDLYTIAFGLRNVTDKKAALAEAHRVLRPGGRFMCLEFSHVEQSMLSQLYDLWSFHCIPLMGQLVAADRASYQYLVESIRQFPTQADLADMIRRAGFSNVTWQNLSGGIVAIHSGYKPGP
ncbi:hypothetical protein PBRA_003868 [Plasmodiophora brassicae]|nr:hypothetical protein PBRA_003868 [Plasmodiophora brassicae]